MLCSIVIPLYNKAKFIEAAIQSVLQQRHQNFEVIVVDDGSTDDGPSRVGAIQDSRVHLVQQPNGGVSRARNRGIELAKGDLVCFLDADDWYLPEYLETIVSMARQYPDIFFLATGLKRVNPQKDTEMFWDCGLPVRVELIQDFFHRWRKGEILLCTNSVAVRRAELLKLQPCFQLDVSMGEDLDLWFRLAEKKPVAYCPAPLVGYRMGVADSLCATHEVLTLVPAFIHLEKRALGLQMPVVHRKSALRLVTEAKVSVARTSLVYGRRLEALGWLLKCKHFIYSRRWWLTLMMCLFATPNIVKWWVNSRTITTDNK